MDFYVGTALIGTKTAAPYSISWMPAATGTYTFTAKATDNLNAQTTSAAVSVTVNAATGNGQLIPGQIEAESFTTMNGVQTENTADTNGGQNVGWIDAGDWMDYAVNVQTAGNYTVQFRVAGWNADAQLQLQLGTTVLCTGDEYIGQ